MKNNDRSKKRKKKKEKRKKKKEERRETLFPSIMSYEEGTMFSLSFFGLVNEMLDCMLIWKRKINKDNNCFLQKNV
jgi:hypothetical protein